MWIDSSNTNFLSDASTAVDNEEDAVANLVVPSSHTSLSAWDVHCLPPLQKPWFNLFPCNVDARCMYCSIADGNDDDAPMSSWNPTRAYKHSADPLMRCSKARYFYMRKSKQPQRNYERVEIRHLKEEKICIKVFTLVKLNIIRQVSDMHSVGPPTCDFKARCFYKWREKNQSNKALLKDWRLDTRKSQQSTIHSFILVKLNRIDN